MALNIWRYITQFIPYHVPVDGFSPRIDLKQQKQISSICSVIFLFAE